MQPSGMGEAKGGDEASERPLSPPPSAPERTQALGQMKGTQSQTPIPIPIPKPAEGLAKELAA